MTAFGQLQTLDVSGKLRAIHTAVFQISVYSQEQSSHERAV